MKKYVPFLFQYPGIELQHGETAIPCLVVWKNGEKEKKKRDEMKNSNILW